MANDRKKIDQFPNVTPISTDIYLLERADGSYAYVTGTQLLTFMSANDTLQKVLTAGNSTGGLPITSPDGTKTILLNDSALDIIFGSSELYIDNITFSASISALRALVLRNVFAELKHDVKIKLTSPIIEVSQDATTALGVVTYQQLNASTSPLATTTYVNAQDAITLASANNYTDNLGAGLSWKKSVLYSTTTGENLTLTGLSVAVDGTLRTLLTTDRILVKNQTTQTLNGLYNPNSGAWTRVVDANTNTSILSATVYVRDGNIEKNRVYAVNVTPITIGTTNITFALISGAGAYTYGAYLKLTGNVFDIDFTTFTTAQITDSTNKRFQTDLQQANNDATSSIQTQINGKQPSGTYATGTGSASGVNTGDQTITLTSDITGSGTGSFVTTLATVNANVGTYGGASNSDTVTVNGKGLITAISSNPIQIAESQVTGLVTDLSNKQATLVSGTNIKTVNGVTLLGAGDLPISTIDTTKLAILNNLSDLNNVVTARTNLGLGTLATQSGTFSGTSSGTNTGDNAVNSNYANDYRLANFVAGTNYLAPNGSASALTGFPTLNQNTTGTASTITGAITESQVTNLVSDLAGKEVTANKDATGGYVGLTLFKINFKNALNTITSFFTNANTVSRTYTFPDKDITVAGLVDITGTNSGTNTGDNATNTQYSGLVTNATHTGDASGATILTLATVNANVGAFNNVTVNAKGLVTSASNVGYITTETDPVVKAIVGIVKSNGTLISAAVAGTDYLTPTGSASALTSFPIFNQSTTGNASTATNLTGLTTTVATLNNVSGVNTGDVAVATTTDITTGTDNVKTVSSLSLVNAGVLKQSQTNIYAIATGTNTYVVTLTPAITTLTAGLTINVLFTNANTTAITVNVNALGGIAVTKDNITPLVVGDIRAGVIYTMTYDGTRFQCDCGEAFLNSPSFTGLPLAPTAPALTNNTQIATTAYVDVAGGRNFKETFTVSGTTQTTTKTYTFIYAVLRNNLSQIEGVDYSFSGTTMTFLTLTPLSSDVIHIIGKY